MSYAINMRGLTAGLLHVCLVLVLTSEAAFANPTVWGSPTAVYATINNPYEIDFDTEGYLYAGHNLNAYTYMYRVPPGGGEASPWGTLQIVDPDAVRVHGDYVYAAGKYDVFATRRDTGVTERWADFTEGRNMCALAVDVDGHYGSPGSLVVGSARRTNDIEVVDSLTRLPTTLVSSADINIPRGFCMVDGQLYCVEPDRTLGLWHVNPTGTLTKVDDGGFAWVQPEAMVYRETDDSFYIGDSSLGSIVRVPRTGGSNEVVGTGFDDISGLTFDVDDKLYVTDSINDVVFIVVPEPSTLALASLGVLGLVVWNRRRKR